MGYTLFNRVGSGGHIIEAALHLAEIPFELVLLDSKPGTPLPETFRTTNPWRQVPTLILPDGSTMTETAAMLIDLATRFPDKLLAPAPGTAAHGQFLRWTIFASIDVYEAMLRYNYPLPMRPQRMRLENRRLRAAHVGYWCLSKPWVMLSMLWVQS